MTVDEAEGLLSELAETNGWWWKTVPTTRYVSGAVVLWCEHARVDANYEEADGEIKEWTATVLSRYYPRGHTDWGHMPDTEPEPLLAWLKRQCVVFATVAPAFKAMWGVLNERGEP